MGCKMHQRGARKEDCCHRSEEYEGKHVVAWERDERGRLWFGREVRREGCGMGEE